MSIKFAKDIIEDIRNKDSVNIPNGYVTGQPFEEWLYTEENIHMTKEDILFDN